MNKSPRYEVHAIIPSKHDPDTHVFHYFGEYPQHQEDFRTGLTQEHILEKMVQNILGRRISYDKQISRKKFMGQFGMIYESHLQTDAISMQDDLPDEYGWYQVNNEKGPFGMEQSGRWVILPRKLRKQRDEQN